MNKKNNWKRDYLGVTAWHEAGYTGKRGLSASAEDFIFGSAHANQTFQILREIAPDRQVIYIPFAPDIDGFLKQTEQLKVDTFFISKSGLPIDLNDREKLKKLAARTTVFAAAGNYGIEKASQYMTPDTIYGVGAVRLNASEIYQGEALDGAELWLEVPDYTSASKYVDFAGLAGIYVSANRLIDGTSCAAPVLAGMAALVNDLFIDKTGYPLTRLTMHRFLKDCARDVGTRGKDELSGWGLPILPPPSEVNISKYADYDKYEDDIFINHAHKRDVYSQRARGIMRGDDKGQFRPKDYLTREQAASVAERLISEIMNMVNEEIAQALFNYKNNNK